eukprot:sb/3472505/
MQTPDISLVLIGLDVTRTPISADLAGWSRERVLPGKSGSNTISGEDYPPSKSGSDCITSSLKYTATESPINLIKPISPTIPTIPINPITPINLIKPINSINLPKDKDGIVFTMTVEYCPDKIAILKVRQKDDPAKLAKKFTAEHGMREDLSVALSHVISQKMGKS